MSTTSRILSTLGLLAATLALPQPAHACDPDPCYYTDRWVEFTLMNEVVATDGVLLFDARRGPDAGILSDAEALEVVSVEVLADGEPVSGALELEDGWRGVVWRPDAPLPADAALSVTLTVDNASIPSDGCEDQPDAGPFPVTVTAEAQPALDEVPTLSEGSLDILETETLDQLVCCDGAYPIQEDFCGTYIYWGPEGHCEYVHGTGYVRGRWEVDLSGLDAELRDNLSWRVVPGGGPLLAATPTTSAQTKLFDAPVCAHLELLNRATGELTALPETCLGEELADMLGPQDLDPSEGLAAECSGDAYTCEVTGDDFMSMWDSEACEPWGDAGGDGDGDPGDGDGDPGDGDGDPAGDGDGDPGGDGDGDGSTDTDTDGETGGEPGAEDGTGVEIGCSCSADDDAGGRSAFALGLLGLLGLVRRRRS